MESMAKGGLKNPLDQIASTNEAVKNSLLEEKLQQVKRHNEIKNRELEEKKIRASDRLSFLNNNVNIYKK